MKKKNHPNSIHHGKRIEMIRHLKGMTQLKLGEILGVTKQAVSKMEQSEKIEAERLKQVASALGVTVEGLIKFTEVNVLNYTNNFYNNSHATATKIGNVSNVENINLFSMEQTIKLFEEQLKIEREKFESLKRNNRSPRNS